jgi:cyclopropane fatty-acyl-phospholipid synthase-like methyltransferase
MSWHSEDAPWKALQISKIIERNNLQARCIVEIGCGSGKILEELAEKPYFKNVEFEGYDISPQAIEICRKSLGKRCSFFCEDLLTSPRNAAREIDILLAIDVFEHVPDYLGFIEKCKALAKYKVYHIPLDLHVSSVLRGSFVQARYSVGHLHYFSEESALATLKDTGHEIVDCFYTNGAFGLFKQHPSLKRAIANAPRWLVSLTSERLSARLLGGYSLMVLAK